MKSILKWIITQLLVFRSKRFLVKNKVEVIAVTGSVGKSTTKKAIFHILKKHFKVHAAEEGFNTPIGVALTILRQNESGFSSIKKWAQILRSVFFQKIEPYEKIILEMGADQPGDIQRLVKIAPPNIGVITAVREVHLDQGQFNSIDEITKEKSQLIAHMPGSGYAILNGNDERVLQMQTHARRLTYGLNSEFDLFTSELSSTLSGLNFKVHYQNQTEYFVVPVLGDFQIFNLLPAIAVALKFNLTLKQCTDALADFSLPAGRMTLLEGVKDTTIIDSSYNSSPSSVQAALDFIAGQKAGRKVLAIGTMNELGSFSDQAHLDLGEKAAQVGDLLIFVGPQAHLLKEGAMKTGKKEEFIFTFFDSVQAGCFLKEKLLPEDLILVKGSQNRVRMERLIKEIMAHPEKASRLLCRQGEEWEKI